MDKKMASKLLFFIKTFVFVLIASALSANTYARYAYYSDGCFKPNKKMACAKRVVYYSGPNCHCVYRGTDCSLLKWSACHWDVYGNYVPGKWVVINR